METLPPKSLLTFGPQDTPGPGRIALRTGPFLSTEEDSGPRDEIWASYRGGRRNVETMIPGYTGFVPHSRSYFSRTYAATCREALREFDQEQKARQQPPEEQLYRTYTKPEVKSQRLNTPLAAVSNEPYKSLGSPYNMEDQNPHKYFISGFTGYVPRSRFLFGTSYPVTTNKALIQFGKQLRGALSSLEAQGQAGSALPPIRSVYGAHLGKIPSYTGHVPGYRFSYGQTYGRITHNAVVTSEAKRRLSGKY